MSPYLLAMWVVQGSSPLTRYWHQLSNPTFRGLYQANAFDVAIMVP